MKLKNALLIIDAQNDFVKSNGALPVQGAEQDMSRGANFIRLHSGNLSSICLTLDSHYPIHIAHPCYWRDKDGKNPAPFTSISSDDVKNGTWTPNFYPKEAIWYLSELEKKGKTNLIWPTHCLIGSDGAAVYKEIHDAVMYWNEESGKYPQFWTKGSCPMTENFSVLKAEVSFPNIPQTDFNMTWIKILESHDFVYIMGEAKSHCVKETCNDIITYAPELAKKVVIVEDCMSNIGPNDDDFWNVKAKNAGFRFINSTDNLITY